MTNLRNVAIYFNQGWNWVKGIDLDDPLAFLHRPGDLEVDPHDYLLPTSYLAILLIKKTRLADMDYETVNYYSKHFFTIAIIAKQLKTTQVCFYSILSH